ncbi:MAG: hypothetical protein ACFCUO_02060 [Rhodospirillales bacterium]
MTDGPSRHLEEIDNRLSRASAMIEAARERCATDPGVDLTGLEIGIRDLCDLVRTAPSEEIAGLGERIARLRDELQALGTDLTHHYQELTKRVEAGRRRPAIEAYGAALGDT